jgi:hypothetical protein
MVMGAGHRGGLESFSNGEAGPFVAGHGEHPGTGERAKPWEIHDTRPHQSAIDLAQPLSVD